MMGCETPFSCRREKMVGEALWRVWSVGRSGSSLRMYSVMGAGSFWNGSMFRFCER